MTLIIECDEFTVLRCFLSSYIQYNTVGYFALFTQCGIRKIKNDVQI